jgi:hypothetical protein
MMTLSVTGGRERDHVLGRAAVPLELGPGPVAGNGQPVVGSLGDEQAVGGRVPGQGQPAAGAGSGTCRRPTPRTSPRGCCSNSRRRCRRSPTTPRRASGSGSRPSLATPGATDVWSGRKAAAAAGGSQAVEQLRTVQARGLVVSLAPWPPDALHYAPGVGSPATHSRPNAPQARYGATVDSLHHRRATHFPGPGWRCGPGETYRRLTTGRRSG